jgi:hypothetical protein
MYALMLFCCDMAWFRVSTGHIQQNTAIAVAQAQHCKAAAVVLQSNSASTIHFPLCKIS